MNELFKERAESYFGKQSSQFLKCCEDKATQGFFLNTSKADRQQILDLLDFAYQPSSFSEYSCYHNNDNIGKTRAYELGLIYPQDVAASLTTAFVCPENIRLIVDMCAAPGGKTINILNRVKGALCISNDVSYSRAQTLSSNLERLGLDNVIVTAQDTAVLAKQLHHKADLVILDAPCSGEGMIRKYPQILDTYSLNNITRLSFTQKQLLEEAYDMLKEGGQLVYSTCTFAPEEDEQQISAFLHLHDDMELIGIDLPSQTKLPGTVKLSFLNNTEGQFFALLRKKGELYKTDLPQLKTSRNELAENFIADNLEIDDYYLYQHKDRFYLSLEPLTDIRNNVLRYGICLGEIHNRRFEPAHDLYRANSMQGRFRFVYELNDKEYDDFITGKEIKADLPKQYYQITYKSFPLGYGKAAGGVIKNKYPKGLRRML